MRRRKPERVRKLGGATLRSIGQISRLQRVADNDADCVTPSDMLAELREDNQRLAARMRESHVVCEEHGDVATASLIEVWIDEAERRVWFLYETSRKGDSQAGWRTPIAGLPGVVRAAYALLERMLSEPFSTCSNIPPGLSFQSSEARTTCKKARATSRWIRDLGPETSSR